MSRDKPITIYSHEKAVILATLGECPQYDDSTKHTTDASLSIVKTYNLVALHKLRRLIDELFTE
jgi:hypothetical protein